MNGIEKMASQRTRSICSKQSENNKLLGATSETSSLSVSSNSNARSPPKLSQNEAIQAMFRSVVEVPRYHGFWMTAETLLNVVHHEFYFDQSKPLFTVKILNKAIARDPFLRNYIDSSGPMNTTGVFKKQW